MADLDWPAITDSGDVAFEAEVTGGSATGGFFVVGSDGVTEARLLVGDVAPDTGGGTFLSLRPPWLTNSGEFVFTTFLADGSTPAGAFVASPWGPTTARVLVGDPAPDTDGGHFSHLHSGVDMTDSGEVSVSALVSGGSADAGIFVVDPAGVVEARVLLGGPAPETHGGTFTYLGGGTSITESGEVAFVGRIRVDDEPARDGIFVVDSEGAVSARVLSEDPAPDTGGGEFASLGGPSSPSGNYLTFGARIRHGTVERGIFVLPEPTAQIAPCLAVLALLARRRR